MDNWTLIQTIWNTMYNLKYKSVNLAENIKILDKKVASLWLESTSLKTLMGD